MSDHRITVTKLIVAVDEVHFVLFITFLDKFGRFEDSERHAIREIVVQMVFDIFGLIIALVFEKISDGGIGFIQWHKAQSFLGFLHGAEQDSVRHPFVAVDGDFVNLDLLGFMDVEKEIDRILANSHDNSLVTCVYGDTDSLYLSYKDLIDTIEGSEKMTLEEKLKIILKINTEFLDKHNKEHLRDYFLSRNARANTADLEDFELETVNKRGVWLHETKKRYGQILLWKEGKYYDIDDLPIKVKGLEVIKSSYPTIARKQLKQMLRFILEYDHRSPLC